MRSVELSVVDHGDSSGIRGCPVGQAWDNVYISRWLDQVMYVRIFTIILIMNIHHEKYKL